MAGIDVDFRVNGAVVASLLGAAEYAVEATEAVVDQASALLLTRVKANASGRPGPNAPTGDYRRSWTRRKVTGGFSVGTNRPQARRLEYGFVGTDSIGRTYNQPPYPHLGPAVDVIEPLFNRRMAEIQDAIARGTVPGGAVTFGFGVLP